MNNPLTNPEQDPLDFQELHDEPTAEQEEAELKEERRARLHYAEYPTTRHLQRELEKKSADELVAMLVDIGSRLSYDEDDEYHPEQSVAARSGADYVESVSETFANAGIKI